MRFEIDERDVLKWASDGLREDGLEDERFDMLAGVKETVEGYIDPPEPMAKTVRVGARLMPEGCEWPRYENGEQVRFGDEFECWCGETHTVESVTIREGRSALNASQPHSFVVSDGPFTAHGKRVKRPAPKVYDADGVEIELGDDLYSVEGGLKFHVSHIDRVSGKIATDAMFALDKWADPAMYAHRAPVLAADGEPLEVGQTVWYTTSGREMAVDAIERRPEGWWAISKFADGSRKDSAPVSVLTHRRPVPDADGEPCRIGDDVWDIHIGEHQVIEDITGTCGGYETLVVRLDSGERTTCDAARVSHRRPVLDADGAPIKKGDAVWHVASGQEYAVIEPSYGETVVVRPAGCDDADGEQYAPDRLTHQRPALGADGKPIKKGDEVWCVATDEELEGMFVWRRKEEVGGMLTVSGVSVMTGVPWASFDETGHQIRACYLTHTKPEADSWERIEEDLGDEMAKQQCGPISPELACKLAGQFVRRCKALAERDAS